MENINQNYTNKILAIRNYNSDKKEFGVADFQDLTQLKKIISEILTGESDITPAGKMFLQTYYGFDKLSNMFNSEFSKEWLEGIVPMETIAFIEECRGNNVSNNNLREVLLPPIKK